MHRNMEEDRTRTAGPDGPKGYFIPCDIVLSNKIWGKEGGKGDTGSGGICLPKQLLHVMSAAFIEVTEHLPSDGN